jgi:hypothetical protein
VNLAGITWGLPARWHPDEKADVAARMARAGTLEPDSFINPSLPLYVEWPFLWIQARATEGDARAGDPLLLGRILCALAGASAVFVIGLAAGRLRRDLGLLAAASLALSPGVANLCHFATPEPWLLLGTAVTVLFALEHLRGTRDRPLGIASAWPRPRSTPRPLSSCRPRRHRVEAARETGGGHASARGRRRARGPPSSRLSRAR